MLKPILIFLLCCLAAFRVPAQHTDSARYSYHICVHQKAMPGETHYSYLAKVNTSDPPGIHIELWNRKKQAVTSAIITLRSLSPDSALRGAVLDTTHLCDFGQLLPGTYRLKIHSIAYQSHEIHDLLVPANQSVKLYVVLGEADAFVHMTISSRKTLSSRQLKRRIKQIEKELNS